MSNRFSKHSDAIREETHSEIYWNGYNHGHWYQPEWKIEQVKTEFPNCTKAQYKQWLSGYYRGWNHRSMDNW